MHALVSGAGIAGLSFAAAMLRLGHQVTLVEQAPELRAVGAGIVLAANATACLSWAGIPLEGLGRPVGGFRIQDLQGRSLGETLELPGGHPTLSVDRGVLLAHLSAHAAGAELRFGQRIVDLAGAQVTLEDGSTLTPDVVVGADGLRSGLRSLVLPPGTGPQVVDSGQVCWRGLFPTQPSTPPDPVEYWGRGSRAGLVPLGQGRGYLYLVENGDGEGMDGRFDDYPAAVREAIAAVSSFHKDALMAVEPHCFVRDGVFFLGDAAHALTPNMGQGACMAIEDAVLLAALLDEDAATAAQRYPSLRRERVRWVADSSERIGRVGQWEGGLACGLRDLVMRTTPKRVGQQVAARLWTGSPVARGELGS